MKRKDILSLLRERPVVGDGSYAMTLEKRGYVNAGAWTPEASVEYPDAVKQLHKDFVRAGADVIQAFTFYSSDDKLQTSDTGKKYKGLELNQAACDLALEVAKPSDVLICGGISPTPTYTKGLGKEAVQKEFSKQCDIFVKNNVDFLLAEFLPYNEEAVWAIEVMKATGKPVACTMRMGPKGDLKGVSAGECAIRMAKAGADIVGLNCQYDPTICLKTLRIMKKAMDEAGLHPFLMLQPVCFHTADAEDLPEGHHMLPEFPLAMESRLMNRFDVRKYAREAYEMGVHYIGGCCGFEPYHIRAVAEELAEERGFRPPGADKSEVWGKGNRQSVLEYLKERSTKEYWNSVQPKSGRHPVQTKGVTSK